VPEPVFVGPVRVLTRRPGSLPGSRGWHPLKNGFAPVTLRVSLDEITLDYALGLGRSLTPGLILDPRRSTMSLAKVGVYRRWPNAPLRIVISGPSPKGHLQMAVLVASGLRDRQMADMWRALESVGVTATSSPPPASNS
jgi:hypothetical protein